ncbi:hypothetical protein CIHG_08994 [Coccidioides immitis H538.4]|uniref:Uncharacterized protein n=1 Tax=Coccidioides immitis H538.4 TaxID=396776 RepID=A0A0J8S3X6_COCIT|nr:hypothetical protein CIHG_08994 [Coccidioides immitis H538.4]
MLLNVPEQKQHSVEDRQAVNGQSDKSKNPRLSEQASMPEVRSVGPAGGLGPKVRR